jgi:hypothetical protein
MTHIRRISLSVHSAIEILAGAALAAAAVPLGFSPTGIVVAVAIGATLVGVGLASSGAAEGRQPVSVSVIALYDQWLGIAMLVAGSALGLSGDIAALALLLPLGLTQLALVQTTRYAPVTA